MMRIEPNFKPPLIVPAIIPILPGEPVPMVTPLLIVPATMQSSAEPPFAKQYSSVYCSMAVTPVIPAVGFALLVTGIGVDTFFPVVGEIFATTHEESPSN